MKKSCPDWPNLKIPHINIDSFIIIYCCKTDRGIFLPCATSLLFASVYNPCSLPSFVFLLVLQTLTWRSASLSLRPPRGPVGTFRNKPSMSSSSLCAPSEPFRTSFPPSVHLCIQFMDRQTDRQLVHPAPHQRDMTHIHYFLPCGWPTEHFTHKQLIMWLSPGWSSTPFFWGDDTHDTRCPVTHS